MSPRHWIRLAVAKEKVSRPLNLPWVRAVLARWYGLVVCVVGVLAAPLMTIPFASSPDHWWDAAKSQVGGLVLAVLHHPVLSALAIIILALFTYLGREAHLAVTAANTEADRSQRKEDIKEALSPRLDAVQDQSMKAATAAQGAAAAAIATKATVDALAQRMMQAVPAILSTVEAPTGLPRPATLVGRNTELDELMAGLLGMAGHVGDPAAPAIDVFALEGMAGVGKSAMAAEAVARLAMDRDAFPGGAAWITCEGLIGDEGLAELWARVARAFGLQQVAAQAEPDTRRNALGRALAQRPRTLLGLDNMEPGLDARTAIETLAVADHTAILLTARHAVAPEKLRPIVLKPLETPDAVTLFEQRLRQSDATRPTAEDEALIPAVVEVAGGLPLAIELAAAYAGVQRLPISRIVGQLADDRLKAAAFHSDPTRALAERFDRSWHVLTPTQQRSFAGLSLLASASFPRAAALAIAHAAPNPDGADEPSEHTGPEGDVAALVSYALIEPLTGEWLRVHPLLREYAASRFGALGPSVVERLGDAAVVYWLAYAYAHPGYEGMDALETVTSGLMGALSWAHEHRKHHAVVDLAGALRGFWNVRGHFDTADLAYGWVIEAAIELGDLQLEAWARHERALVERQLGRWMQARANLERALTLAHETGDPRIERPIVRELAVLDETVGDMEAARSGYDRAAHLAEQTGDPVATAVALFDQAVFDSKTGQYTAARVGFQAALDLASQQGDIPLERQIRHNLALLDSKVGQLDEARAGYTHAYELAKQMGDVRGERDELYSLALHEDDLVKARAGYEQALVLNDRLRDDAFRPLILHALAGVDLKMGQRDRARAGYERARNLAQQVGDPVGQRAALHELAAMDADEGEWARAREGFERALDIARRLHDPEHEALELMCLAREAEQAGEPDRVRELLQRSQEIWERLGASENVGDCHWALAQIDVNQSDRQGAIAHVGDALRWYERAGSPKAGEVRSKLEHLRLDGE
jgi:tetratricopeptide (TPR) repeat protein